MAEVDGPRPRRVPGPPLTLASVLVGLLFLGWLWGGYLAVLSRVGRLPFAAAAWTAALCLAAIPLLLYVVVKFVALPKPYVNVFPRAVIEFLWVLGSLAEVLFPWLGWSTLLWALHGGSWWAASVSGAGLAAFSYLTGLLILWLFRPGPRSVQITELELPLAGLPAEFDGYRILHLSDLHVNAYSPPEQARRRVARARDLPADVVAFTGDLTDRAQYLESAAEILGKLARPDGLLAVMGNHDNWRGAGDVTTALRGHGITPLINVHHTVTRGDAKLHFVGVDNAAYSDRDDLAAALEGIGEEETVILLSHAPEVVLRPQARRAELILCGHTHGGQIVLPLLGAFYLPSKVGRQYPSGLFPFGRGWLFVSRGLGEIFPPLRVLCPPEVAVLTLRRAGN